MGMQEEKINGGWGEWDEWTKCSRTCGGGISVSQRHCDNPHPQNHGQYCVGEKRRIRMCNIEDCVLGPSYRDMQCMSYNEVPFKNKLHAWKPYHVTGHECDLTCINEDNVFVTMAKAKDGTPCKRGLNDRCIFGKCRRVGCDWVVDSPAIEDICGICNGDGTHCRLVEKEYNDVKITASGYHKIDVIPAGVRNINIHEKQASPNTIAISTEDGKTFYLNGDYTEEVNGDKYFGDVLGIYEHPTTDKESLFIPGPTKEPLALYEVFYGPDNPGVKYTYTIPSTKQIPSTYLWQFTEYGHCSAFCDWGYRVSEPICLEKTRGEVSPKFCDIKLKPDNKIMECFIRECKTKWHPSAWGKCSGCKNKPGVRNRTVECIKESPNAELDPMIVDDSLCTGVKPKTQQMCCSEKVCQPNAKEHSDEAQKKIAGLGTQLQRIYKKKKKNIEIFKPERHEIKSDLRNLKDIRQYLKEFKRSDDDASGGCSKSPKINIFEDHVPDEGLQLVEVPIIQDSEEIKLSDVGIERSGDKVADTLNFCKAKLFKGKEADEELKHLKACNTAPTKYK